VRKVRLDANGYTFVKALAITAGSQSCSDQRTERPVAERLVFYSLFVLIYKPNNDLIYRPNIYTVGTVKGTHSRNTDILVSASHQSGKFCRRFRYAKRNVTDRLKGIPYTFIRVSDLPI